MRSPYRLEGRLREVACSRHVEEVRRTRSSVPRGALRCLAITSQLPRNHLAITSRGLSCSPPGVPLVLVSLAFRRASPRGVLLLVRPTDRPTSVACVPGRRRTRAGKFFLYYENGKCACRVDTSGRWVAVSVHLCLPRRPDGAWDDARLLERGRSNDARNRGLTPAPAERAAVLHYPLWDAEALWRKYELHGAFSDTLVSGATTKGGLQWGACFHTECRDHYLAHRDEPDRARGAMADLFRRTVCLHDAPELERQIACGVLVRIPTPAAILHKARDAALGRGQGAAHDANDVGPPLHDHPAALTLSPTCAYGDAPMRQPARVLWTAGQLCKTPTYQLSWCSVERADFRGPRPERGASRGGQQASRVGAQK